MPDLPTHWCDWFLPTVITTNANGNALAAKFTATDGGPASVRRLREHATKLSATQDADGLAG